MSLNSRMIATLMVLAGCSGTSPTDLQDAASTRVLDGLRYTVETRVMESFPVQIAVEVTLTNIGDAPASVRFPDGCVVTLRALRDSEEVWDQRTLILCTAAVVDVELDGGASESFSTTTSASAILGSSLPDGKYQLRAVLRPDGRSLTLDAGEVDLAVLRTAYWSQRPGSGVVR
jgi:hypothetical protein